MISLIVSLGGVGVYHIGKNISYVVFSFMNVLENVFKPQVFNRMFNKSDLQSESIGVYLTPFIYISTIAALSLALFSEELVTIILPPSYHGSIPIISILSVYYGSMFLGKYRSYCLLKKRIFQL